MKTFDIKNKLGNVYITDWSVEESPIYLAERRLLSANQKTKISKLKIRGHF